MAKKAIDMNKYYVVNEDDEVVGVKESKDIDTQEIQRVSMLWLTNSNGEVLIAQRAFTKRYGPGEWGPAVAGTVEEGEDYVQNIIKETEEEIGVTITEADLRVGPKELWKGDHHRFFLQWYFATKDVPIGDIVYPPEEVAAIEWISPQMLRKEIQEGKRSFTSRMREWAREF